MALWKEAMQNEQGDRPDHDIVRVSPIPPRKESLSKEGHESVFAAGLTIEGKVEGNGDVRMAGQFKGDIQVKGDLNIEKGAHINGKVNADTVTIGGELEGNIVANAQVKLLESGQLIGDLKATTLIVAAGSRMRGNVEFGWSDSESSKIATIRPHDKGKSGSVL
jgi:cytoskeletal protein CcmA (bactofilin family)